MFSKFPFLSRKTQIIHSHYFLYVLNSLIILMEWFVLPLEQLLLIVYEVWFIFSISISERWRNYSFYVSTWSSKVFPSISLLYYIFNCQFKFILWRSVNDTCSINSSLYKEASELVQNISDELYILHDLLNCGVKCVEECITSTFLRSVLQNVCYPAILNSLSTLPPTSTHVSLSLSYSYSLVFNSTRSSFVYSSFDNSI